MSEIEKLKVADIMTRDVVTTSPEEPLRTAVERMKDRQVGSLVVVDRGTVVGIMTERDLVQRAAERCREWDRIRVGEIMSSPVTTVRPYDPWTLVALRMDELGIRHVPVTTDEGELVGIVTARDLLHHRAVFLEAAVRDRTAELEARNAELIARERLIDYHLRLASRIQRQLLPREFPRDPRVRLADWYQPVDRVSGDFYDIRRVSPDCVGVIICDASGHGIPAAMVSVIAQTVFRTARDTSCCPAELLHDINNHLRAILEQERFVTACYGKLDLATGTWEFAKAGHPPPLLYRARDKVCVSLDAKGMLLGVSDKATFEEVEVQLAPGDRLIMYTDGLVDTWNDQGELLGLARVRQWVAELGALPPDLLLERLQQRVHAFRGHRPFSDDLTVVVIGYEGPDRGK